MSDDFEHRGTLRALSVLQALNRDGGATVMQLHRATGLPRPSIYRIVNTLCLGGYVRRSSDRKYRLTFLVRMLSDGLRDDEGLLEVAAPILDELGKTVQWPTDLSTFLNYSMYLRDTTRQQSPLTLDRATVGWRLPMLKTAHGRAYLAFCPIEERELILKALARSRDPDNVLARQTAPVRAMIEKTREMGFGSRNGETDPKTGSIAVPIVFEDRVLGCMGITFIASALTPAIAADQHLSRLKEAAANVELLYREIPERRGG